MTSPLIDHVEQYGLHETYAQLAQRFGMTKAAVRKELLAYGLAPGGTRSQPSHITISAAPWEAV